MSDLSGYSVEFFKVELFNTWSYRITTPTGQTFGPLLAVTFSSKEKAEKNALHRIENHQRKYRLTGEELKNKIKES